MDADTADFADLAGYRLNMQRNYEPKLRELADTRCSQLGFDAAGRAIALRSMDALAWKLTAAGVHLERLWENRESRDLKNLLSAAFKGVAEPRRYTDSNVAFLSAEFEAYLIQARALVSVAQLHTLHACRIPFRGQLTNTKYKKEVSKAPTDVHPRLMSARSYFEQSVFSKGKWGSLLRSLRDRAVHFDRVRPSRITSETDQEELTVTGLSLERLAQDFENGTYDLLVNVIAPIWGREWLAGPYRPKMWE